MSGPDLGVQGILGRAQLSPTLSSNGPDGDVAEVAKQFEAVMLQQMVSALRKTANFGGEEDQTGSQLIDHLIEEGLATHISRSGGIGLASMIAADAERAMAGPEPAHRAVGLTELRRSGASRPSAPASVDEVDDTGGFALPSPEELDRPRGRKDAAEVLERIQRFEGGENVETR